MSLFIVLLQIFRVVVIQPCEFKTRHLRKQQGNLQFCYNFSSVLSQVKGLPVAKSHKKILFFKCSSTPERKVPQRSDASQNDHKSKGHPSKTSEAAFTMQKADKINLRRLARPPLKPPFKNPIFQLYSKQLKYQPDFIIISS